MPHLEEANIFLFLVQLGIILILARSIGELFRKVKLPVITAELLVGILLGPTILGRFFPAVFNILFPNDIVQNSMLETAAWIGVLFLLLDTGLEMNFSSVWKQKTNAFIIATSDIIIPMMIAFVPSYFLSDKYLVDIDKRLLFALFLSTIMTISDMPITSKVLHDLNLLKTELGFLTMSALAINDIIGWAIFTIILGMFSQSVIQLGGTFSILFFIVLFSFLSLTAGRKLSNIIIDFFDKNNFPEPSSSFTFACVVGILSGAITQIIGIHALFGFFIAGVVVGEATNLKEETRSIISQMVHALFVPIFFVNIGLKIDFIKSFDWFLTFLITFLGIAGRYLGAWIGVSFSKISGTNKNIVSIAHTPGGMMGIVVANIALQLNLITPPVFIAIVFSSLFSSILMGPWISLVMKRRKLVRLQKFMDFKNGTLLISTLDKKEAILQILNNASLIIKDLPVKKIFEDLIKRENVFSSAIGNFIAIPHIRTDIVSTPVLLFGFSKNGIEWNSPDGKPVHIIFFLFSPANKNDLHVEILSKIANIFQKKENIGKVINTTTKEELKKVLKNILS